jgi:hypothetical protein
LDAVQEFLSASFNPHSELLYVWKVGLEEAGHSSFVRLEGHFAIETTKKIAYNNWTNTRFLSFAQSEEGSACHGVSKMVRKITPRDSGEDNIGEQGAHVFISKRWDEVLSAFPSPLVLCSSRWETLGSLEDLGVLQVVGWVFNIRDFGQPSSGRRVL